MSRGRLTITRASLLMLAAFGVATGHAHGDPTFFAATGNVLLRINGPDVGRFPLGPTRTASGPEPSSSWTLMGTATGLCSK